MCVCVCTEKAMATHSSTLAWKIPWVEKPRKLQSMGSPRVGHDRATSLSLSCTEEGNGNPRQCSCLENPRDEGAWWAAVYGVTQSRTWRSSSSSVCVLSCVWLFVTPWIIARQTSLTIGSSRQEHWSGMPCSPARYLPDSVIQHACLMSSALAGGCFTTSATWEAPLIFLIMN